MWKYLLGGSIPTTTARNPIEERIVKKTLSSVLGNNDGDYDDDDGEDLEEARREKARSEILTSLSEYLEKEGNQLMSILVEQGIVQSMVCKPYVVPARVSLFGWLPITLGMEIRVFTNDKSARDSLRASEDVFKPLSILGNGKRIEEHSLPSFIENSIQNIDLNQVLDKSGKKSELGRVFATSKKWAYFAPTKGADNQRFIFQRVTANFYSLYDCVLTPTDEFCQDMELLSQLDDALQKIEQEVHQITKSV
ncbi:hypothetical protein [Moraxella nasicaprae]|uniref:Uncharacterized protein n=1 Tax=Moraxella nasicaprae TaxID=2904122 RepID=A0ABY6F3K8_9GAMM|nr:hypothetical protein [Moraxella nasicaprae]UXZ04664.1 hypothetical protein LU297_08860 [Moraxella nasicaprae]